MSSIMALAIKLISARSYSEQDLKKRLEKKSAGLPDADVHITAVLMRLRELQLVDDRRLAENLAIHYSHKGNRFLAQVLRQKGISDEIITETMDSSEGEYPRALAEARKKCRQIKGCDPVKTKARLYRFLSARGFSHDVISATINELSGEGLFETG